VDVNQDMPAPHFAMHAAGVNTLWAVQLHSAWTAWTTGLDLRLFGSMAVAQQRLLVLIVIVLVMLFCRTRQT